MLAKKMWVILLGLSAGLSFSIQAEKVELKHFMPGSYPELLSQYENKPLMLAIWSTSCTTCMEKMPLLGKLKENHPEMKIVMLTTDNLADKVLVQTILTENGLDDGENWIFADENAQRLRYEIDPQWYGELPRTYFLNANHEREGISGALSYDDYQSIFKVLQH